jgi:hypothetical protein
MSIPLDLSSAMQRDPDGGFLPMSEEEYAFAVDPADRTPEQSAAAGRYIEATGFRRSPAPERGTGPGSRQYYNSHSAPCEDTAGGSPPRSRTGRPARSRS